MSEAAPGFARHRTALARTDLSRPARLALNDGVITQSTRVLDYGCGRGGDIRRLREQGIDCDGWDPAHRPDGPRNQADVVNLGYVVNVIEDVAERAEVLRTAWSLATKVLVVAARLEVEAHQIIGGCHQDGFVTRLGTFQKLYHQDELRRWIDGTLEVASVPAGPGVFYIFRDEAARQTFLASRYRRLGAAPRVRRSDELFERHKDILQPLLDFLGHQGRLPQQEELSGAQAICEAFGSIQRAFRVVRAVVDEAQWEDVQQQRTEDLLIYLALSRFSRRPRLTELSAPLQLDMRAFFTSYKAACELADALLFSAGHMPSVDRLCQQSKIGKQTPSALYVHVSALDKLAPVLRIYEGCARAFIGAVESANVIKLHRGSPQVSYLSYPGFDTDPHPRLDSSLLVALQTFRIEVRHFSNSKNPPILHRKEEFVAEAYPQHAKFARLTAQEERHGLYESPERIGTQAGWEQVLQERGVSLRGHRVVLSRG
ncbi:MAG TPA: DNA phosphorothioation-associated putative methyltransferase [Archangium sp.]|uniref:DNA phosphorothioation-associated putative methyltransferase n=1 Tax=Archangium sp. TaxID=1872627 RepID=UPI002E37A3DC|nr:DNA phosphorothioation-associated putative methyltransferase [Archangium sp.]HEX5747162.1 DNA phosphorothioation-associated putative methyltransferase [Archangium sp.]